MNSTNSNSTNSSVLHSTDLTTTIEVIDVSKTDENSSALVAIILCSYCIAGTLLTLLNKNAISFFPHPLLILMIQNTASLLIVSLAIRFSNDTSLGSVRHRMCTHSKDFLKTWIPLVLLFTGMLLSSLLALQSVTATSLIVMRNLTTITTAALEFFFFNSALSKTACMCIVGMLFGATIFGMHDMAISVLGYAWLFVNIACTSCYQVYVKGIAQTGMHPLDMSFFNNLLSIAILVFICVLTNEFPHLSSIYQFNHLNIIVLFATCFCGCILSVTAFRLNQLISATAIMVANNANKFSVILFSEIAIQRSMDSVGVLGCLFVLTFGWCFSVYKHHIGSRTFSTLVTVLLFCSISLCSFGMFPNSRHALLNIGAY